MRWMLFGSALAWLTLLAPPLIVIAWLTGLPPWPLPVLAVPVAPLLFGAMMKALRGDDARRRKRWVQAFGLGALLAPLVVVASLSGWLVGWAWAAMITLLAWVALAGYAHRAALTVHEHRLEIHAPALRRPVRLVQLSDVHIGSRSPALLEELVRRATELAPDAVVITGDLIDASDIADDALGALKHLPMPVVMCLGNHERYTRLDRTLALIEGAGVQVLRDSAYRLGEVSLLGLDDRDRPDALPAALRQAMNGDPDSTCRVLLYHRPDGWSAARAAGVPLMLAGHTHGGQIWPFGLAVRRAYPHSLGRFDADGCTLYVSPGAGTWGPTLRLGTRSEITLVTLSPTAAADRADR